MRPALRRLRAGPGACGGYGGGLDAAAKKEVPADLLRNTLGAATSHGHRTPLGAILGTGSSLHDQGRRRDTARRVTLRSEPGLPLQHCGAVLLAQLLENRMNHALKYGGDAPADVVVQQLGDRRLLAVRDRGLVAPAWRGRIFAAFQRGEPAAALAQPRSGQSRVPVAAGPAAGAPGCRRPWPNTMNLSVPRRVSSDWSLASGSKRPRQAAACGPPAPAHDVAVHLQLPAMVPTRQWPLLDGVQAQDLRDQIVALVMAPARVQQAPTVMRAVAQEALAHPGGLRGGAAPAAPRRSGRGGRGVVFAGRHRRGVQAR